MFCTDYEGAKTRKMFRKLAMKEQLIERTLKGAASANRALLTLVNLSFSFIYYVLPTTTTEHSLYFLVVNENADFISGIRFDIVRLLVALQYFLFFVTVFSC